MYKKQQLINKQQDLAFVKLLTILQASHNHQEEEDTELAATTQGDSDC